MQRNELIRYKSRLDSWSDLVLCGSVVGSCLVNLKPIATKIIAIDRLFFCHFARQSSFLICILVFNLVQPGIVSST